MKKLITFILIAASAVQAFAETVKVTDKKGRSIMATLIDCDGEKLNISRATDSKAFTLSMSDLSEETKGLVNDWLKAGGNLATEFEVEVRTGRTRTKAPTDDFDDKRVNLEPSLTVSNPDNIRSTKPLQLTALFLGKPVEDISGYFVFSKETVDLPKIAPLGSKDFTLKPVSKPYDSRGYAKFGARYLGHIWIIHDKATGQIVCSSSVPASLAGKNDFKFLKLKADTAYPRSAITGP